MNPFRKLGSIGRLASAHRKASLGVASAAILAAGAGIGFGVSDATSRASASPTTSTTAPATGSSAAHHRGMMRGRVVSKAGDTWTVQTAKGKNLTVIVSSTTQFGTKASPLSTSGVAVGDEIGVSGHRQGLTVTATRVVLAHTPKSAGAATAQ